MLGYIFTGLLIYQTFMTTSHSLHSQKGIYCITKHASSWDWTVNNCTVRDEGTLIDHNATLLLHHHITNSSVWVADFLHKNQEIAESPLVHLCRYGKVSRSDVNTTLISMRRPIYGSCEERRSYICPPCGTCRAKEWDPLTWPDANTSCSSLHAPHYYLEHYLNLDTNYTSYWSSNHKWWFYVSKTKQSRPAKSDVRYCGVYEQGENISYHQCNQSFHSICYFDKPELRRTTLLSNYRYCYNISETSTLPTTASRPTTIIIRQTFDVTSRISNVTSQTSDVTSQTSNVTSQTSADVTSQTSSVTRRISSVSASTPGRSVTQGEKSSAANQLTSSSYGLLVGAPVAAVLVLGVGVIIAVIYCRRHSTIKKNEGSASISVVCHSNDSPRGNDNNATSGPCRDPQQIGCSNPSYATLSNTDDYTCIHENAWENSIASIAEDCDTTFPKEGVSEISTNIYDKTFQPNFKSGKSSKNLNSVVPTDMAVNEYDTTDAVSKHRNKYNVPSTTGEANEYDTTSTVSKYKNKSVLSTTGEANEYDTTSAVSKCRNKGLPSTTGGANEYDTTASVSKYRNNSEPSTTGGANEYDTTSSVSKYRFNGVPSTTVGANEYDTTASVSKYRNNSVPSTADDTDENDTASVSKYRNKGLPSTTGETDENDTCVSDLKDSKTNALSQN